MGKYNVIDSFWFGQTGIVRVRPEFGEDKFYIGRGSGRDQKEDEQFIAAFGNKFTRESVDFFSDKGDLKIFTNEFEFDETVTTIMDETGEEEDVQVMITEHGVFIRQFPDAGNIPEVISLTHKMFRDMIEAMQHTEGFYITEYKP